MKNYIYQTFGLVLLVVAALSGLYFLPELACGGKALRKVDLLSDIRKVEQVVDTLWVEEEPEPVWVDTCKAGITCIEDYADSTGRGMAPFFAALDRRDGLDRPVRIAVFGDSFIEADIFTADLRNLLQSEFGGCGVGFVPITSATYGFRPTVRHSFDGWESHLATDSVGFDGSRQGIASAYFLPQSGTRTYVELKGQRKYAMHLDTCEVSAIYFMTEGEAELFSSVNGGTDVSHAFEGEDCLRKAQVEGTIGRIRWTVQKGDSACFYGVAMDGKEGISLDNFSLRGSSGFSLRQIPARMLRQFNALRPYDLIILQYGLNVATERGRNYDSYKTGMLEVVRCLKETFPQAGILLLGVADRDYRTETGELRTMPGIKNLLRYQQMVASESHVAFWNLFQAMGGDGSMADLVHADPPMANRDYTHINFRGGKHLAELLYETLVYGKEQYDRKKK